MRQGYERLKGRATGEWRNDTHASVETRTYYGVDRHKVEGQSHGHTIDLSLILRVLSFTTALGAKRTATTTTTIRRYQRHDKPLRLARSLTLYEIRFKQIE